MLGTVRDDVNYSPSTSQRQFVGSYFRRYLGLVLIPSSTVAQKDVEDLSIATMQQLHCQQLWRNQFK